MYGWRARRVLGTIGVVGAMLATVVLEAAMGSTFLVDTRQQTALLLPFWCLLWLAAILAAGVWWAMPWAAFVSSAIVQTHFSYVYLVAMIAAAAVAAAIWLSRDGLTDTRWRRATAVTAVVLLAVLGADGVGPDVRYRQPRPRAWVSPTAMAWGRATGARIVAESVLVPPFWTPGGIQHYLHDGLVQPADDCHGPALAAIVVWAAAAGTTFVVARRRATTRWPRWR